MAGMNAVHTPTRVRRPVAQRRYAPKTKTGCVTCKIRRVKCDEAKPCCKRCTSTGRKCDGYAPVSSAETNKTAAASHPTVALVNDVTSDALEKRIFDFFRTRTAPCVSGYFRDSVWDRMILQVCHTEPVVRHAVNALGSLHEERFLRKKARSAGLCEGADFRTNFPIKQYAKALNGLQKLLSSSDVNIDLVLICSLVFIHFEALRESFVPAILHLENAIRLLHSRSTYSSKAIDPGLVRAMMRTDIQGAMYLGMRVPGLPFYTADTDSELPTIFHDLTQARDIVNTWTCRKYHFMRTQADFYKYREPGNLPLELIARSHELERDFRDLDRLLVEFMNRFSNKLTIREQHGLDMLRIRVKFDLIAVTTCLYAETYMLDTHLERFEEILTICKYTMDCESVDRRLLWVSLDEGLLNPLMFVACNCRDGRIRHQALDQLKKLPNREGIWHVEAMTRLAEVCISYEERPFKKDVVKCEDIPEWRRVHSAGFDGWDVSQSKAKVTAHLRTRPNGMDGEWCDVQEPVEFWASDLLSDIDDSNPVQVPLPDLYFQSDGPEPLHTSMMWNFTTEPWMATLPLKMWDSSPEFQRLASSQRSLTDSLVY